MTHHWLDMTWLTDYHYVHLYMDDIVNALFNLWYTTCEVKRWYLLTSQVSRYRLFTLQGSIVSHSKYEIFTQCLTHLRPWPHHLYLIFTTANTTLMTSRRQPAHAGFANPIFRPNVWPFCDDDPKPSQVSYSLWFRQKIIKWGLSGKTSLN